jgi:hypothetical protein
VLSGHGVVVVNASVSHVFSSAGLIVERELSRAVTKTYNVVHRPDAPPLAALLKLPAYTVRAAGDR